MAKKKNKKNMLNNKNVVIFSVLAAVLIFVGLFIYAKKNYAVQNNTNDDTNQVVETSKTEIKEEIKDGVYTNYTYGFSFEYDNNLFSRYETLPQYGQIRFDSGLKSESVRMFVDVLRDGEGYSLCKEKSVGQYVSSDNSTKKVFESEFGCAIEIKTNEEEVSDVEEYYGYSATFNVNGVIVRISIYSTVDSYHNYNQKFKDVFYSFDII